MKSLLKTRKTVTYSYNSFLACSLHSLLHCLLNSSCFHSLVVYLQAKINIALFCKSSSSLALTRAASSSSSNCRWCKRKKTKEPLKSRTIDHRVAGSSPRGHVFFRSKTYGIVVFMGTPLCICFNCTFQNDYLLLFD